MTTWYVKDVSKLTGISVQTLHYYDRITLLKPTSRLKNGYRLYTVKDLATLQRIMALKFFGFTLAQIKTVMAGHPEEREMLERQALSLGKKARVLQAASDTLTALVAEVPAKQPMPWQTITQAIELYKMTKKLEHTWAHDVLTPDELKQYATIEADCDANPQKKQGHLKQHARLMSLVEQHSDMDPKSTTGYNIAEEWMSMINGIYGAEHTNLKLAIWEKGYKSRKVTGDWAIAPAAFTWLDQAIDHYYRKRIGAQLSSITESDVETASIPTAWSLLLHEICGDSAEMQQSLYGEIQAEVDSRAKCNALIK